VTGTIEFDSGGHRGRFQDRLELTFLDVIENKLFAIVKPLLVIVGDSNDYEMLRPTEPYVPHKRRQREVVKDLTPGERLPALADIKWVHSLGMYEMAKGLKTILDMPSMKEKMRLLKRGYLPPLTPQTHARFFHVLLHVEEYQSMSVL
jgi:helicase MOV-10